MTSRKIRKRVAAKRAVETRRLYRFENVERHYSAYSLRRYSLRFFRRLADRLCPGVRVDFGPGTPHAGARVSFCDWDDDRRVELAPGQRTLVVFLHEITHALGFGTHGRRFVRKYFELLVQYGKCKEGELKLAAGLFGIKT